MKKIGLALSGGGFRASLYHLGLIRFLRDAGILPQVTQITSVSGGSIIAAHLVLNWDRYTGSPGEFDAAASEFLAFVRLDIRNRIVRRFPLGMPLRGPRRLLGLSNRKLSRTGLLEYHYERYLYGDTSLFELPERPTLHILATNLSEGCLCSFNRSGLLMMRRQQGHPIRSQRIRMGLATVPMAVTASSAFPGFFPPIELTGADVGVASGEFGRQAFTDGGVFDNLGVRMFRYLQRPSMAETRLSKDDFVDFPDLVAAFRAAGRTQEESPLRRLAQILVTPSLRTDSPNPTDAGNNVEQLLLSGLDDILRHVPLQREPLFAALKMSGTEALQHSGNAADGLLEPEDQLWLNRQLLEAAFRQATGHAGFRRLDSGLDGVLVSDVGKQIEIQENRRAGGVIRTAMRAADILMDRVWQLENDTFAGTPGFVFARITDVVDPHEDPTAQHPEIQRQVANIRTDLDRFSELEINSLIRHGYCVGRKICRANPELFDADAPATAPWDPIPAARTPAAGAIAEAKRIEGSSREPAPVTASARTLQRSAVRRIWSTLLDWRDWTSYIYVPIIVPLLFITPYLVVQSYRHSHRDNQLIESLSQGSRDLRIMRQLLDGPMPPFVGEIAEEVRELEPLDFEGFEVLQDSRILDLRPWNPKETDKTDTSSLVYGYRRIKVLKLPANTNRNLFRIYLLPTSPKSQVRFPLQQLEPKLRMMKVDSGGSGEKTSRYEASFDFSKVPAGEIVEVIYEHYSPGLFMQREPTATTIAIRSEVDTAEVTRWFLMPAGREYRDWRLFRYKTGKPETIEPVKVLTEYLAEDATILAYKLLSVNAGYTNEVRWTYK